MVAEVILAKSPIKGQQISLSEHVTTVSYAAQYLFGSPNQPTRLGTEWLRFFGLTSGQLPEFLTNLQLAALVHDLGKANDGFQATLRHQGQQAIRHEHLSALLLYLEPIRDWLSRCVAARIDFEIVLSAVVSHHLKVNDQEFGKRLLPGVDSFNVFTQDADFVKCLRLAEPITGAPPPDLSAYDRLWSFEHDVDPRKGPSGDFGRSMHNFKRKLQKGSNRHRLLVAVKAGLIAADSAGSALIREGHSLEKWISDCFEYDPLTAAWVEKKIIQQRISEIERKSDRAFEWHDFQIAAGELGERALLLSGCGKGENTRSMELDQKPIESETSIPGDFSLPDSFHGD